MLRVKFGSCRQLHCCWPLWLARHYLCRYSWPEVRFLFKMDWQRFGVRFPSILSFGTSVSDEGGAFPLHRPPQGTVVFAQHFCLTRFAWPRNCAELSFSGGSFLDFSLTVSCTRWAESFCLSATTGI